MAAAGGGRFLRSRPEMGYFDATCLITKIYTGRVHVIFEVEGNGRPFGVDFSHHVLKNNGGLKGGDIVVARIFPTGPSMFRLEQIELANPKFHYMPVPRKIFEETVEVARIRSKAASGSSDKGQRPTRSGPPPPGSIPVKGRQGPSGGGSKNTTREPKGPPPGDQSKGFEQGQRRANGKRGNNGGQNGGGGGSVLKSQETEEKVVGTRPPQPLTTQASGSADAAVDGPPLSGCAQDSQQVTKPTPEFKNLPSRKGDEDSPQPKTLNYDSDSASRAAAAAAAPRPTSAAVVAPQAAAAPTMVADLAKEKETKGEQEAQEVAEVMLLQEEESPSDSTAMPLPLVASGDNEGGSTLYGTPVRVETKIAGESISFDYGGSEYAVMRVNDKVEIIIDEVKETKVGFETAYEMLAVGQEIEADINISRSGGEARIANIQFRPQHPEALTTMPTASSDTIEIGSGGGGDAGQVSGPPPPPPVEVTTRKLRQPHQSSLEVGRRPPATAGGDEVQVVPTSGPASSDDVITGSNGATQIAENTGDESIFQPMASDISYYEQVVSSLSSIYSCNAQIKDDTPFQLDKIDSSKDHTVPARATAAGTAIEGQAETNLYEDPQGQKAVVVDLDLQSSVDLHTKALQDAAERKPKEVLVPITEEEMDQQEEGEQVAAAPPLMIQEAAETPLVADGGGGLAAVTAAFQDDDVATADAAVVNNLIDCSLTELPVAPAAEETSEQATVAQFDYDRKRRLVELTMDYLLGGWSFGDTVKNYFVESGWVDLVIAKEEEEQGAQEAEQQQ